MIKIWNDRKEAFELCRNLKPIYGKKIDMIWKSYQTQRFNERQELLSYLHSLWESVSGGLDAPFDILPPPNSDDLPSNGIILGHVRYLSKKGQLCRINSEQLSQHVLIVGESGSGKTTLLSNILIQLDVPWIAFDLKQDYRHLVRRIPSLKVMRWEKLDINPLIPPSGISASEWISLFSEVFSGDLGLMYGSKGFLESQCRDLFIHFNSSKSIKKYPTMLDLKKHLETLRIAPVRRIATYLDVVYGRIQSFVNNLPSMSSSNNPIPVKSLYNVLELDGLIKELQDFIVSIFLIAIFRSRMCSGARGKTEIVIVLDEAKRIFDRNKEKRPAEGIPTIDILISQIREFGIAMIIADQEPSKLATSVLANTRTKILLSLGNQYDGIEMSKAMNLDNPSQHLKLPIGCAIIKHPVIPEPFIFEFPESGITKNVTEQELVLKGSINGLSDPSIPIIDNPDTYQPKYRD